MTSALLIQEDGRENVSNPSLRADAS